LAKANVPVIIEITHIDVEALTELADTIAHCLYALEREKEIPDFLNHVESVVPLTGYKKSTVYLRALWLHIGLKDKDGAIRELHALGNIHDYPRREAWELYLDVAGSEMTERQKIEIAENIIAEADGDEHVRVQYTVLKALALLQIGEADAARKAFDALVETAKSPSRIESSDELSAEWQIARAWSMYGELFRDPNALLKAERGLRRIPEPMLKAAGKAALQRDLGWVLRDQERYCEAAEAFERSLKFEDTDVGKIHLVHSLALCGKIDDARSLLQPLDPTTIDPNLHLEYLAAQGSLAIASNDTSLAARTAEELQAIAIGAPFWDVQRKQLIIQMLDFVHRPDATRQSERQRNIIRILLFLNEVLELKPHFFGVGVNINKVIEKLAKRIGNDK